MELLKLATVLLGDRNTAEDIVHDVFVTFAGSAGRITLAGSLRSYLSTSVVNRVRNHRRNTCRHGQIGLDGVQLPASGGPEPLQWAILSEQLALLTEALQQLPYEQREVICLRMEMDMSFHRIAAAQNVPLNTAKGRYRYAMERLRSLLNSEVRQCDPQIVWFFREAGLGIHPDADERVFQDMLRAQQEHAKKPETLTPKGRPIMKNPLAKFAIAAAVVVACVMGLFMWTGTQSSVALADVLTRLQQVNVYMYQMTLRTTGPSVGDATLEHEARATALMSQDLGMKMTMEMDMGIPDPNSPGPRLQEMYMLPQQKRMVTIMPGQKRYMQIDFDEAQFEERQKQNNDPKAMVQQILNCDYTSLGRSTIDGVEVEGFQTTDPNYVAGLMGKIDVKIWVDVKTQLPIRSEMDMQMGDQMHVHAVIHDFQWDVSVDASEFEPVIPDDYTTVGGSPLKMPAMNEETAIQGLRLFAELSGRYPEKLDMMTLMAVMKDLAKRSVVDGNQPEKDSLDERTKELVETLTPVMGIGSFYTSLVQDKKHPAYYGDVVTPEDADQVLMRWQVSETEYRVIFGSLRAETVRAEVLADLEKTLPRQ